MQKIAIFNRKGGVGKTTAIVQLASIIAQEFGFKVLCVDGNGEQFDLSRRMLTYYVFKTIGEDFDVTDLKYTIVEALKGKCDITDAVYPVYYPVRLGVNSFVHDNVDCIPSRETVRKIKFSKRYNEFEKLLAPLEDKYDICFFDCSPTLNQMNIKILEYCNYFISPVTTVDSVSDYGLLLKTLVDMRQNGQSRIVNLGCFFSSKARDSCDNSLYDHVLDLYGTKVFDTVIRQSSKIKETELTTRPIIYQARTSDVCNDYIELARELLFKIGKLKNEKEEY